MSRTTMGDISVGWFLATIAAGIFIVTTLFAGSISAMSEEAFWPLFWPTLGWITALGAAALVVVAGVHKALP